MKTVLFVVALVIVGVLTLPPQLTIVRDTPSTSLNAEAAKQLLRAE